MELPYGVAYLHESQRPLVFVAGGTGVSPILALLREVATTSRMADHVRWMFYGANTPEELVLREEIESLIASLPEARFIPVLCNQPSDTFFCERGFVTEALPRYLKDFSTYDYYLAGPPVMVHAALALLREHHVPITQIHYDSFG